MRQYAIGGVLYDSDDLVKTSAVDQLDNARYSFTRSEQYFINGKYYTGKNKSYFFEDNDTGRSSLREFREIVTLCKRNGIDLFLFISPTHASQTEVIRALGLWPVFEQWKRDLVGILDDEYENLKYRLWDFSGYNSITSKNVPTGRMREYKDSSHYYPVVGDMVLSKIMGGSQEGEVTDFGMRLNSRSIEKVLDRIRKQQYAYHESHIENVKAIKALAAKSLSGYEPEVVIDGTRPIGARLKHL